MSKYLYARTSPSLAFPIHYGNETYIDPLGHIVHHVALEEHDHNRKKKDATPHHATIWYHRENDSFTDVERQVLKLNFTRPDRAKLGLIGPNWA